MIHIYKASPDADARVLLLLHGTGGTEHDLLKLAPLIDPEAAVLSLRGNVQENGENRFFRRLADGSIDVADWKSRSKALYAFLDESAVQYGFDRRKIVAVGYSNGANIAIGLLFHYQDAFMGAILHHPLLPARDVHPPSLKGLPIFIGAGTNDPICKPEETEQLSALLTDAGAAVDVHWESYGHHFSPSEVKAAARWYKRAFANRK